MIREQELRAHVEALTSTLRGGEKLSVDVRGEASDFLRLNSHGPGFVRQTGRVEEVELSLRLVVPDGDAAREARRAFTLSGHAARDLELARAELEAARALVAAVPPSPWVTQPSGDETSSRVSVVETAPFQEVVDTLAAVVGGLDASGIVAQGDLVRASATSTGRFHWFETSSATIDLSLYGETGKAVKIVFALPRFDAAHVRREVDAARLVLPVLAREPHRPTPGDLRTYLAPAAVAEIVTMLSWGCVSEAAVQQGESPLRLARRGERTFSPAFSLSEDFSHGDVPRFNELGELSPERVPLVEAGALVGTLVSTKTAKEYGVTSNQASPGETLRAPTIAGGALASADAMRTLGTGVFASNLWYLNWSDQPKGRITGMTRYASLWVEDGAPRAPLAGMRFDDTIFRIFGTELEGLTEPSMVPDNMSYDFRNLGGARVPGVLLRALAFAS